jgi:hypothetical protein
MSDTLYTSAYLWWLIHKQKLIGLEIFEIQRKMHGWCCDCVAGKHRKGSWENNFSWDSRSTIVDGFSFPNCIWFKYEEDLLAFRLRFGIGS